ncbi:unnamed protein product [Lymnaea stagnalis]|uniref:nicotinamidase n=1 Tax=Lymnaea stagnalis TaxID=6523 RepID=A0AAV2H0Z6_LYMST
MVISDILTVTLILTLTLNDPCHAVKEMRAAMLVLYIQDCFLPGGSVAVNQGETIIPIINNIRKDSGELFKLVVLSKESHCPHHVSFASSHPGKAPYDVVQIKYLTNGTLCSDNINQTKVPGVLTCPANLETLPFQQKLWPDHCVEDVTSGPTSSSISKQLTVSTSDVIIKTGTTCQLDTYSAFYDNGHLFETELEGTLKSNQINTVFVMGLAPDFDVTHTALDAISLGYKTFTVVDASKFRANGTEDEALAEMSEKGVVLIRSDEVKDFLTGKMPRNTAKKMATQGTQLPAFILYVVVAHCYFLN